MTRGYYFITDHALSRQGVINDVRDAVQAGAVGVQYRNKISTTRDMYLEACELRKICKKIPLIINDRVDIALAADADGVHLGGKDLPYEAARSLMGKFRIVGVTVRSVDAAVDMEREGADYLGVGPIYHSTTKGTSIAPIGVSMIRDIKKACLVPIAAIGGINLKNAHECLDAGADVLCALSAVITADDVKAEVAKFCALLR
ncbi:MAG: thiamine phosphate synthase [Candidatus Omnitrophica bacterium]|nr:thiamine phosphate synthase [Candidatus Omnitrophota bacterium]MBU1127792.1 thiamine phosphate synthase [Candidatus Omnitrophota bacterium]MBU1656689.1 thiamine phosphate synthase [Candidatus Omnitrophota bacterium]MBU1784653.1 thiamine phosphate synthase [Candidatus Omnitrophota bacterium]MBU1852265.1 thiamine phosphate synthase [Candidatus Omnitrophota bacterium]